MKKNGFTLVEILAVIVLISLLIGLGSAGISRISQNMKNKSYNTKVDMIEQAGILWGQDNKALLQSANTPCRVDTIDYSCAKINIERLINEDYLESEKIGDVIYNNPKDGNSMLADCVYVYKKNNRVTSFYAEGNSC